MNKLLNGILILTLTLNAWSTNALEKSNLIKLYVGSVKAVHVGKVVRVAVGIDGILATSILENGQLLLIPKQAGETDIRIWKEGERVVTYRIVITASNIKQNVNDLSNVLADFKQVKVRSVGGMILVEGLVVPERFELFNAVVASFPGVVNKVAEAKIFMKDMINFKIQVLEVNKNYAKNVGISWDRSIAGPNIGYVQNFKANDRFVVLNGESQFGSELFNPIIDFTDQSAYGFLGIATSISSKISLLKEDGAARTLAEPSLSTRSGAAASFHSGGQYPLAVLNEFGQPVVQMQDYGIQLSIEPISDDKGNIVSKIHAEMSTLDFSIVVNGVPGLLTRSTESVVNMRSGETMIISGLVQVSDSKAVEKVPFLGDIPILGELFKSKSFFENKTELIVLVTPTIVAANTAIPEHLQKHMESIRKVLGKSDIESELLE